MNEFSLKLVTPDKIFLDTKAYSISVIAEDGSMGFWANHKPEIVELGSGIAEILTTTSEEKIYCAILGGVLMVDENHDITVLSSFIEYAQDAEEALRRRDEFISNEKERRRQSYEEFKTNTIDLLRQLRAITNKTSDTDFDLMR